MDLGLSHIALPVTDIERSIAFYERYAAMQVVHRRVDPDHGTSVAWCSDRTRPFAIVMIEHSPVDGGLTGDYAHLGVGVASRAIVDERAADARDHGIAVFGPTDAGPPVGYYAILRDPDGHNLELSFGQSIGLTIER